MLKSFWGGGLADVLWTDPPYGVDYEGKTKDKLKIKNDKLDDLKGFLFLIFSSASAYMKDGAAFYIAHPAGALSVQFGEAVLAVDGWLFHQTLIWKKNSMVMGYSDYHYKHEPIIYGWKKGAGRPWYGDRKQTSVIEVDRPTVAKEHPTMKPIGLVAHCLRNSSKGSDVVLDTCCGSGTTLIAADQLNRICYGMEIDPKYCDVIIERYRRFKELPDGWWPETVN